jgi:predicted alpha-1,6-mannanase (GH76 family)
MLHHRFFLILWFILLMNAGHIGDAQSTEAESTGSVARSHLGAEALVFFYNQKDGLFNTMGWWNSANAITTLADEASIGQTSEFDPIFSNTFKRAQLRSSNFRNEFYDDEGWWALAWIDVYELRGDEAYLRMAQSIFEDMTGGWDNVCGGGIWWKKNRRYKSAIANELFLSVAAKLALHSEGRREQEYLKWAKREWKWFDASGMINHRDLINDGLDQTCRNNGQPTWSYNQGVIMGGLTALSVATQDQTLLPRARRIASAAIRQLSDADGVLHDACEPDCGRDGVQFKGIFARNLAQLQRRLPDSLYVSFLQANANAVWNRARTSTNHFSVVWSGPPQEDNASALSSALDVLVAAASLKE